MLTLAYVQVDAIVSKTLRFKTDIQVRGLSLIPSIWLILACLNRRRILICMTNTKSTD